MKITTISGAQWLAGLQAKNLYKKTNLKPATNQKNQIAIYIY